MKLKCIIFDVDGTMADTERNGHRVAFNLAFQETHLDWYWNEELYGQLLNVTGGKERMSYYQNDFLKKNTLSENEITAIHQCKTNHYVKLLKSGKIPLRKGVKNLIEQALQENIKLAISTTTTPVNVSTLLKATLGADSESIFDVIAAGDVILHKKPAPDIYYYTLNQLGLKAENCIAIEDSSAGLAAAFSAGIKTIITTNKYTQDQDFSNALKIYPNLGTVNTQSLNQFIGENHV